MALYGSVPVVVDVPAVVPSLWSVLVVTGIIVVMSSWSVLVVFTDDVVSSFCSVLEPAVVAAVVAATVPVLLVLTCSGVVSLSSSDSGQCDYHIYAQSF